MTDPRPAPDEPQMLTVKFKTKHSPGTREHLIELLKNALTPKGIEVENDGTIVI